MVTLLCFSFYNYCTLALRGYSEHCMLWIFFIWLGTAGLFVNLEGCGCGGEGNSTEFCFLNFDSFEKCLRLIAHDLILYSFVIS